MTYSEKTNSNIVEVNGIIFETLMPEVVVKIPNSNSGVSPVQFGIRVTNVSSRSYRFMLPYVLPELFHSDGQAMQMDWARNAYHRPKKYYFQLARPQESLTFFLKGEFKWYKNVLILIGKATDGAIWKFFHFHDGIYRARFTYRNEYSEKRISRRNDKFSAWQDFWIGEASTPFVDFCLQSS